MEDGAVARRGAHRQSLVRQVVRVRAPAKINLLLRVFGLRADGFHELETLFQAIHFTDELTVELAGDSVWVDVEGTDAGPGDAQPRVSVQLRPIALRLTCIPGSASFSPRTFRPARVWVGDLPTLPRFCER